MAELAGVDRPENGRLARGFGGPLAWRFPTDIVGF